MEEETVDRLGERELERGRKIRQEWSAVVLDCDTDAENDVQGWRERDFEIGHFYSIRNSFLGRKGNAQRTMFGKSLSMTHGMESPQ